MSRQIHVRQYCGLIGWNRVVGYLQGGNINFKGGLLAPYNQFSTNNEVVIFIIEPQTIVGTTLQHFGVALSHDE
jgi:hypothetical protein